MDVATYLVELAALERAQDQTRVRRVRFVSGSASLGLSGGIELRTSLSKGRQSLYSVVRRPSPGLRPPVDEDPSVPAGVPATPHEQWAGVLADLGHGYETLTNPPAGLPPLEVSQVELIDDTLAAVTVTDGTGTLTFQVLLDGPTFVPGIASDIALELQRRAQG